MPQPQPRLNVGPQPLRRGSDNSFDSFDRNRQGSDASRPTERPLPTADDLARLSQEGLRTLLEDALRDLELNLSAEWRDYLQTSAIAQALAASGGAARDMATDSLRAIAARFDQVSQDARYAVIGNQWGFRVLQRGIPEHVLPIGPRAERRLAARARALQHVLDNMQGGAPWNDFLSTPALAKADSISANSDRLRQITDRFEQIRGDARFVTITESPEFRATQTALTDFLSTVPKAAAPEAKPAGLEVAKGRALSRGQAVPALTAAWGNGL